MDSLRSWFRAGVAALGLLTALASTGLAQQGRIVGQVLDETSRRPLDLVQVFVPGTPFGAITTPDGRYELTVPPGEVTVRAQRIGYRTGSQTVTVRAGDLLEVDFVLPVTAIALEEIVATGTGVAVEKRKLGNTISTISLGDIENAPVRSFSEVLQGRVGGVVAMPSGGLTGEGTRIRIRGSSSLSQPNEPIVYVDGVRVDRGGGFGRNIGVGGGGSPSRLDDINPAAIERVEILKGAAAATLYGTEASNGVLQIFTKKGARGAPRFDFTIEQGFMNYPGGRYKANAGFARTPEQAQQMSEFFGEPIQPFQIVERPFVERLFETGHAQTYSGSVSGGTQDITYYVSGRFTAEDGPFGGEELHQVGESKDFNRRVQASANLTIFPAEKLRLRITNLFSDTRHQVPENNNNIFGILSLAMFGKPELASCSSEIVGPEQCAGPGNPTGQIAFATVREAAQLEVGQDTRHYTGALTATYTPWTSLNLEATVGVDIVNQVSVNFWPFGWNVDDFGGSNVAGARALSDLNRREITVEAKSTWTTDIGENWSSTLVTGAQGFIERTEEAGGNSDAFPGPGLEVLGAGANRTNFEVFLEVVNAGLFAQEQLGYKDFAFLTVGGRWDRNSAFGEETSGEFYPKASLSVIPSQLDRWSDVPVLGNLSTLRVRTAIGQSGLQPGAFDKFTTFGPLPSVVLGPGLTPDNLGNPELKPEVTTEWELGAEFGLFEDRLALDVTYWDKVTKDALVDRQFPPSGGFLQSQIVNLGRIDAHGWDLGLNALLFNQPNFSVDFFANAAFLSEIITDMGGAPPIKVSGTYTRPRNFIMEGHAPGSFFGAKLEDVPAGTLPYDLNGDGQPDTEQELLGILGEPVTLDDLAPLVADEDGDGDVLDHFLGKPLPDWQGSFGATFRVLGNVELYTNFEYKAGNYHVQNLTDGFRDSNASIGRNHRKVAEIESTLLNPASSAEQRLDAAREWLGLRRLAPFAGLNQVEKADYVRWNELSLTYRVPTDWARRTFGFSHMSITASVRNLALWTGYSGIDPEANWFGRGRFFAGGVEPVEQNFGIGIDAFGFPLQRRYTFAVNFGF